MRIVVFGPDEPLRTLFPEHDVVSKHRWVPCRGCAAYVAFDPAHLARYEAWFPGVTVRAGARTRDAPLRPGEALYLPVTHDSWLVLLDAPDALPAALEAARLLAGVRTLVVPELPELPQLLELSPGTTYRRWQDRVMPVPPAPHALKAAEEAGAGP